MPKKRLFTTEEDVYIVKRFNETGNATLIGRELNVDFNVIKKALKRLGLNTIPYRLTDDRIEAIRQDYVNSDLDGTEIAIKHRVTKQTIYDHAKANGWVRLNWKRRHFEEVWSRHLSTEEAARRTEATRQKHREGSTGINNPMYGRPSPQGAGNGWKGWYRDKYFRSLREAMFMVKMDEEQASWSGGENGKYTVPYRFEDRDRTYRPDFVIGKIVYEIKPRRLQSSPNNVAKQEAARVFFAARGMTYVVCDIDLDYVKLREALDEGRIKFDRDYETRFRGYLAKQSAPTASG